ncbi:VOC family protein [Intrasporangium flavum]|uniref:VOC family protein n=1 Tax=Intrasporangium flavum TaxID=1428657 RepID=UPI00096CEE61|nr:VOC family protein [Intrasporangium flavum]
MEPPRPALRVGAVSLDCGDHRALARFWADLLAGRVLWSNDHASAVDVGGLVLVAQQVEGHVAPAWPGTSVLHLDLTVEDAGSLDALADRAVSLGASLADPQPDLRWRVLLDPAGHPFCITPFAP